jgi:Domain of unknown function (DUF397)
MHVGQWIAKCDNSGGNCVEVMDTGAEIVIRDKNGATVSYDHVEWDNFVTAVSEGMFTRNAA